MDTSADTDAPESAATTANHQKSAEITPDTASAAQLTTASCESTVQDQSMDVSSDATNAVPNIEADHANHQAEDQQQQKEVNETRVQDGVPAAHSQDHFANEEQHASSAVADVAAPVQEQTSVDKGEDSVETTLSSASSEPVDHAPPVLQPSIDIVSGDTDRAGDHKMALRGDVLEEADQQAVGAVRRC